VRTSVIVGIGVPRRLRTVYGPPAVRVDRGRRGG
jgi:hypothetical protein